MDEEPYNRKRKKSKTKVTLEWCDWVGTMVPCAPGRLIPPPSVLRPPSSSLLPCLHAISRQYASSHTRAQPALPPHKRGRDLFLRPTPAGGDAPGSEGARVLIHGSAATSPGTG